VRCCQAAASEDSEYEARKAAALAVEGMLQSTKADLQRMLESIKGSRRKWPLIDLF
jgi:hypothetical protein